MSDSRVEKLETREEFLGWETDELEGLIEGFEAAGLVVFDPFIDDTTINRLVKAYYESLPDPFPSGGIAIIGAREIRAVLEALAVHT